MMRERWEFSFEAAALADAAAKKKLHHADRLAFWERAKSKVMADVRETGIEVSESEAGGSYANTARAYAPQVMVRADLQKRLSECHGKILEHAEKVKVYEGWVQVLKGNPAARLSLHADDYLFFFGD
jgi:hypothetical protein